MNKKTKNMLLDIAAEMIVLPITAFVTVKRTKDAFNESEAGKKIKMYAGQAGREIGKAAKKAAESEKFQDVRAKIDEFSAKAGEKVKGFSETAAAKFEEFKTRSEEAAKDIAEEAEEKADAVKDAAEDTVAEFADKAEEKAGEAESAAAETVEEAAEGAEKKVSKVQGELDKLFAEVSNSFGRHQENDTPQE